MQKAMVVAKLKKNPITRYIIDNGVMLFVLFIMVTIITVLQPRFIEGTNLLKILRMITIPGIVACGMTLVIITGGIDLSVGSIVALSGIVTAYLNVYIGLPVVVAMLIGVLVGTVCGFLTGALIANTITPPFIVTMAAMSIYRGISYVISKGLTIMAGDDSFGELGNAYLGGFLPIAVIILVVMLVISAALLSKTKFGRYVYSIGGNKEAARFAGININKTIWTVYIFCGLCSGLAGVMQASRLYSGQPSVGVGLELDAIAAVVVGGASMSGGIGKIGGTIIGSLIIGVLQSGLNILNVDWYFQYVLQGAIILLAVLIDLRRRS
jgi:ribose transport system permease protein